MFSVAVGPAPAAKAVQGEQYRCSSFGVFAGRRRRRIRRAARPSREGQHRHRPPQHVRVGAAGIEILRRRAWVAASLPSVPVWCPTCSLRAVPRQVIPRRAACHQLPPPPAPASRASASSRRPVDRLRPRRAARRRPQQAPPRLCVALGAERWCRREVGQRRSGRPAPPPRRRLTMLKRSTATGRPAPAQAAAA